MLRLALILLLWLGGAASPALAANALAGSPSPYLAMHAADPVQWQRWGPQVFERARAENRLVYVSSGYFACHWCHVMQRESYRDPAIAGLFNRDFIPVKVDRELDPALDARLIDFVERTRGVAGWPLNVFITPQGYPLVGFVYLPPSELKALLADLAGRWAQHRGDLEHLAQAATLALRTPSAAAGTAPVDYAVRARQGLLAQSFELADELQGGFGDQSKFPSVPQLGALLQIQARTPSPRLAQFLRLSLDQMATQGLWDQLGGGFFRYTVDPGWQVPHFEKMLYDNAQLARLYLRAAAVLGSARYARHARATLDFMLRALRAPDGGFIASLSAVDAAGVEGGYYLWGEAQVRRLLSAPQWAVARRVWGLGGPPDVEGGDHLVQAMSIDAAAHATGRTPAEAAALLAQARERLLHARAARDLPRDDKRLAAWNGLALSALAAAVAADGGEGPYLAPARALARFLLRRIWDGERLVRAAGGFGRASLEDYAYVAAGLSDWAQASGDAGAGAAARSILTAAWVRFHGPGGWRMEQVSLLKYADAAPVLADGPMPSPAAEILRRSDAAGGALRRRARAVLFAGHAEVLAEPFWHASHIAALLAAQP